ASSAQNPTPKNWHYGWITTPQETFVPDCVKPCRPSNPVRAHPRTSCQNHDAPLLPSSRRRPMVHTRGGDIRRGITHRRYRRRSLATGRPPTSSHVGRGVATDPVGRKHASTAETANVVLGSSLPASRAEGRQR